jgi:hypothetical protein
VVIDLDFEARYDDLVSISIRNSYGLKKLFRATVFSPGHKFHEVDYQHVTHAFQLSHFCSIKRFERAITSPDISYFCDALNAL